MVMVAALLVSTQCGVPYGRSEGGDGNPSTGSCEIQFEETVSGVHLRYPVLYLPEERFVAGKVIFVCDLPPRTHFAVAFLQTRRSGAGQQWLDVRREESRRIPRPKEAIFLPGHCDPRTVAYWRVKVTIEGATEDESGLHPFKEEAYSRENRIECP
jgi:hypothetical protein